MAGVVTTTERMHASTTCAQCGDFAIGCDVVRSRRQAYRHLVRHPTHEVHMTYVAQVEFFARRLPEERHGETCPCVKEEQ